MAKGFNIKGGIFTDNSTGQQIYSDVFDEEMHYYAILVKCGHVGKGKYMPVVLGIEAPNKEMAIQIALRHPRVKSMRAGSPIIDIMEITKVEANYIGYINDCDPYKHGDRFFNNEITESRSVIMEQAIDFENTGNRYQVSPDAVKTSDKYANVHVLQRYLAPRWSGEKLVIPKKINFRKALDEHFYYSTLHLGIIKNKVAALSFYYEIFGPKNKLYIKYRNGIIGYMDKIKYVSYEVGPEMKKHLDAAEEKFKAQIQQEQLDEKEQEEQDKRILAKKQSKVDKFRERDKKRKELLASKYEKIKDSNTSNM